MVLKHLYQSLFLIKMAYANILLKIVKLTVKFLQAN